MENTMGLIHLYCGDGKGKTTAAMGLALRAAGQGFRVLILQFLKNRPTGEVFALEKIPGITLWRGKEGSGFSFQMTPEQKEKTRAIHNENLKEAIAQCKAGKWDVLILDEAVGAYGKELLDQAMLLDFLDHRPSGLEVVLTGRNPDEALRCRADYITRMEKEKHPYDRGIPSRIGIEK